MTLNQLDPRNRRKPALHHLRGATVLFSAGLLGVGLTCATLALDAPVAGASSTYVVTNCNSKGTGSLLDGVITGNSHPGLTINFALSPACSEITLSGTLAIVSSMTINGPGSIKLALNGGGIYEIFSVGRTATVSISGLTIEHGHTATGGTNTPTPTGPPAPAGGNGAGLSNQGALTLSAVTIEKNIAGNGGNGVFFTTSRSAQKGGVGGAGGGIFNTGTLTITGSTIALNSAGKGGQGAVGSTAGGWGGDGGVGGGIFNSGVLDVTSSTISSNIAGTGGPGGVTQSVGTFPGVGGLGGGGGGIFNSGTERVTNVTLSLNSTAAGGKDASKATFRKAGDGGAILTTNTATTFLTASTVTTNSARKGGSGAGIASHDGAEQVGSSIFDSNFVYTTGGEQNCDNSVVPTNRGGNVETRASCGFKNANGSITNGTYESIGLGTLQYNGGPTETESITPLSDAYHLVLQSSGLCPAVDERGVSRLKLGTDSCDAGAYEYAAPVPHVDVSNNAVGVTAGGTFTFSATLSPEVPAPTGTIAWNLGGPGSPSCPPVVLTSSTPATCKISHAKPGVFSATATYSGDPNYTGSSGTDAVTIDKANPTVLISDTASSTQSGGSFAFKATVLGPATGLLPTGIVTWVLQGPGQPTCQATALSAETATCTVKPTQAGTYEAAVIYGGDANYTVGANVDTSAVVAKATTKTHLTESPPTVPLGGEQATKFSATVSPQISGTPTGTVEVLAGSTKLCSFSLSHGKGSCSPRSSAEKIGSYKVKATYEGSTNFLPSTSPSITWRVT